MEETSLNQVISEFENDLIETVTKVKQSTNLENFIEYLYSAQTRITSIADTLDQAIVELESIQDKTSERANDEVTILMDKILDTLEQTSGAPKEKVKAKIDSPISDIVKQFNLSPKAVYEDFVDALAEDLSIDLSYKKVKKCKTLSELENTIKKELIHENVDGSC